MAFVRGIILLSNIVTKIKYEEKCSWEAAVAWSVSAKNALVNRFGFSPYQHVFGRNINLPTTLTDKQPAFNGQAESLDVGAHLSALHAARRAFISAESSEKIRRALRRKTRQTENPSIKPSIQESSDDESDDEDQPEVVQPAPQSTRTIVQQPQLKAEDKVKFVKEDGV
uniref:uncharacterized protein LOC113475550 n=1 Tax=Ciona intestinalis TaxID=7719 RepID=UPI000EF4CBF7|nr:uncharacterized protein LOC113475550 [Ciona intestinalis]|eukprot:XP_026695565.1 uncharacterized protein LOC113475550 [Ciona intestinalis]